MARAPTPAPPDFTRLGSQCKGLKVVLRATSAYARPGGGDHEATWLFGHTERLTFGQSWVDDEDLFVRASIHVPCKHLETRPGGKARCRAHGFEGGMPKDLPRPTQPRQLGGERFRVIQRGRVADLPLPVPRPRRVLRVLSDENPCATARCRTADNTIGSACCRDLQIEIMCDKGWTYREALIRSRKSPYLCKVHRDDEASLEAELISACAYLSETDGVSCTLHGRRRPNGGQAKPDLCRRWPKPTTDETLHPGCVFARPAGAGV